MNQLMELYKNFWSPEERWIKDPYYVIKHYLNDIQILNILDVNYFKAKNLVVGCGEVPWS